MQRHFLWNPEVVKHFKGYKKIQTNTVKGLFTKLISQNGIKCIKKEHSRLENLHPLEHQSLKEKCEKYPRSVYIPNPATILLDG